MKNEISNFSSERSKFWWTSLLAGVLAIVIAWSMIEHYFDLKPIINLFIFGFLISGLCDLLFAFSNQKILRDWLATLLGGLIDIIAALIIWYSSSSSKYLDGWFSLFFYLGIAFWLWSRSAWVIIVSLEFRNIGLKGWGGLLSMNILTLLLAIGCLPALFSEKNTLFATCITFGIIWYGISRICYSLMLKKLNTEKVTKNIKEINKFLIQ